MLVKHVRELGIAEVGDGFGDSDGPNKNFSRAILFETLPFCIDKQPRLRELSLITTHARAI